MIDEARLKVTVIPAIALLLIATPGRADEQHMLPQDKARLSQFIQQKVQQEGAHAATDQPPGHVLTPWSDLAKRIAPQAAQQERKDRVARKEWVSGFVKACIEDTAPLI